MTEFANRRRESSLELDHYRVVALAVACPECQAAAGERCRNVNDGGPLNKLPHLKRTKAAGVVGRDV